VEFNAGNSCHYGHRCQLSVSTRWQNWNGLAGNSGPTSEYEVELKCPVHDDSNPSVLLNIQKNVWKCHAASCNAKGDIISLIAHIVKVERHVALADLQDRYELVEVKAISVETVEKFHQKIATAGPLLQAIRDKGVLDQDIREARLGYHDGRITIPIYDRQRRVVNIRRYLPNAPGPQKMKNTTGYAGPHIFQIEQLDLFDTIWLCGGEMKALVAKRLLNPLGVGAVSITAGEGAWHEKFGKEFKGKTVYVCMDIDTGGKVSARKYARHLVYETLFVATVQLPLDKAIFPKGDINNYVFDCKATGEELLKLQDEAEQYRGATEDVEAETEPLATKLGDAAKSEHVGKRISFEAIVQTMDTTPYIVPHTVLVACTRDQPNCDWCPVRALEPDATTGKVELTIKGTAQGILSMVNAPQAKMREATREALRVPICKAAVFTVKDNFDVIDSRLIPQLETQGGNESVQKDGQPALIVNHRIDSNTPYKFTGRVYPHPKNQQAVLLINNAEEAEDSLSSFTPSLDELEQLKVFQAKDIQEKLDDIYTDFESNVTRIFHRRDFHLAVDLMYHSVLYLPFDCQIQKGWVNVIIVGDSSQGKSELSSRIMGHFGLGERVDCKNATAAGLLGGCQKMGDRWFVTWGVIPIHDRRAVILEEVKGAPITVLSTLTDMRSSGIAEVDKIEKRRAHARTRLLFISNPRSAREMTKFAFGLEAIKEVIGSLEDVRRFDMGLIVSNAQVDPKEINKMLEDRPESPHKYTAELCRRLVLWSWTRTPSQVVFYRETERACLDEAIRLCDKYSEAMPLVDRGTMRFKLARLAAALAARLFNVDPDDMSKLCVDETHVRFVAGWLDKVYSDTVFGYEDFSKAQKFASSLLEPDVIRRKILSTKFPKGLVDHLLYCDEIIHSDIQDWCALDRDAAQDLLSFFVRQHSVQRGKKAYTKTGEFIALLKIMKQGNLPNTPQVGGKDEF
jgi:hypothetical protein